MLGGGGDEAGATRWIMKGLAPKGGVRITISTSLRAFGFGECLGRRLTRVGGTGRAAGTEDELLPGRKPERKENYNRRDAEIS